MLLFHNVSIQYAGLLEVVRYRILRQKRRLQPDFGSNPLALIVRRGGRVITSSSTAKLRPEIGALDLIELLDLAPGFITHRARNIDFQSYACH